MVMLMSLLDAVGHVADVMGRLETMAIFLECSTAVARIEVTEVIHMSCDMYKIRISHIDE